MLNVTEQWDAAYGMKRWLDQANGTGPLDEAFRIMKLTEEAGEVVSAYIGMTGQNPRKGVTHTREDVCGELADVIITAMIALASVADRDPAQILDEKLVATVERAKKFSSQIPAPR